MLVLTRKQQESVFINDNVVVTVLSIRGNKVRLGIEAPLGMPVHREEVHQRIWEGDLAMNAEAKSDEMPE